MALDLAGKHVVIVGGGKSGLAAARLCVRAGARPTINDKKTAAESGTLEADARDRRTSSPACIEDPVAMVGWGRPYGSS